MPAPRTLPLLGGRRVAPEELRSATGATSWRRTRPGDLTHGEVLLHPPRAAVCLCASRERRPTPCPRGSRARAARTRTRTSRGWRSGWGGACTARSARLGGSVTCPWPSSAAPPPARDPRARSPRAGAPTSSPCTRRARTAGPGLESAPASSAPGVRVRATPRRSARLFGRGGQLEAGRVRGGARPRSARDLRSGRRSASPTTSPPLPPAGATTGTIAVEDGAAGTGVPGVYGGRRRRDPVGALGGAGDWLRSARRRVARPRPHGPGRLPRPLHAGWGVPAGPRHARARPTPAQALVGADAARACRARSPSRGMMCSSHAGIHHARPLSRRSTTGCSSRPTSVASRQPRDGEDDAHLLRRDRPGQHAKVRQPRPPSPRLPR